MDPITLKVLGVAALVCAALGLPVTAAVDTVEIGPELSRTLNTFLNLLTLVLMAIFGNKVVQTKRTVDDAIEQVATPAPVEKG